MKMQYDRLAWWRGARIICCREWGLPPWEFDAAFRAGKIRVGDIRRTVHLAMSESQNPVEMQEMLVPGFKRALKRQQEINNINAMLLKHTKLKRKGSKRGGAS